MSKTNKLLLPLAVTGGIVGSAILITAVVVTTRAESAKDKLSNTSVKVWTNALTSNTRKIGSSTQEMLNFEVTSELINVPIRFEYKPQNAAADAKPTSLLLSTNSNDFQLPLGALEPNTTYDYKVYSTTKTTTIELNELLTSGSFTTNATPVFTMTSSTQNEIKFLISQIDKTFVGSTLTVTYYNVAKPNVQYTKEVPVSGQDHTPDKNGFYQVDSSLTEGIEKGARYIVQVKPLNITTPLLQTSLIVDTKDDLSFSTTSTSISSYGASFEVSGVTKYVKSGETGVSFLVEYTAKAPAGSAAGTVEQKTYKSVKLTLDNPLKFSLENLNANTQYEVKLFLVQGTDQTQIGTAQTITTKQALEPKVPRVSTTALLEALFANAKAALGDSTVANYNFHWVAKPVTGKAMFNNNSKTALTLDNENAKVSLTNTQVKYNREYVAQIFHNSDTGLKSPLLKTNYEFTTLHNLTQTGLLESDTEVMLALDGLQQLAGQDLTFRLNEKNATTTTNIDKTYKPSTEESQVVKLTGLTANKTYTVKIFDSKKDTALFTGQTFEVKTLAQKPTLTQTNQTDKEVTFEVSNLTDSVNYDQLVVVATAKDKDTKVKELTKINSSETTASSTTSKYAVKFSDSELEVGVEYTFNIYYLRDSKRELPLATAVKSYILVPLVLTTTKEQTKITFSIEKANQFSTAKQLTIELVPTTGTAEEIASGTQKADFTTTASSSDTTTTPTSDTTTAATKQSVEVTSLKAGTTYTVKIYAKDDNKKTPIFSKNISAVTTESATTASATA
ncbi:hypothetical protein ACW95P_04695 [Candidatus Mycoplasma pogonae]